MHFGIHPAGDEVKLLCVVLAAALAGLIVGGFVLLTRARRTTPTAREPGLFALWRLERSLRRPASPPGGRRRGVWNPAALLKSARTRDSVSPRTRATVSPPTVSTSILTAHTDIGIVADRMRSLSGSAVASPPTAFAD